MEKDDFFNYKIGDKGFFTAIKFCKLLGCFLKIKKQKGVVDFRWLELYLAPSDP